MIFYKCWAFITMTTKGLENIIHNLRRLQQSRGKLRVLNFDRRKSGRVGNWLSIVFLSQKTVDFFQIGWGTKNPRRCGRPLA